MAQKAVVMTKTGKAEWPSHMIDEMRKRFSDSRQPFYIQLGLPAAHVREKGPRLNNLSGIYHLDR